MLVAASWPSFADLCGVKASLHRANQSMALTVCNRNGSQFKLQKVLLLFFCRQCVDRRNYLWQGCHRTLRLFPCVWPRLVGENFYPPFTPSEYSVIIGRCRACQLTVEVTSGAQWPMYACTADVLFCNYMANMVLPKLRSVYTMIDQAHQPYTKLL